MYGKKSLLAIGGASVGCFLLRAVSQSLLFVHVVESTLAARRAAASGRLRANLYMAVATAQAEHRLRFKSLTVMRRDLL